ncbi:MAG TPA: response regulator [Longimicrobiales bacterium]|nr:response regulator [Longimicrobiales bacterium]
MPTILLVEDNDLNRDMLSRRLSRRGYDVEVAVDGAEALEKARAVAPDLVLMDMSLPVLDGWAATRELRASDDTRDIPVIALTAHAMAEDRGKALDAGCDDFDTKPVEFARLLGKIEALLNRGSADRGGADDGAEDGGESASVTDEHRSGGGGAADAT